MQNIQQVLLSGDYFSNRRADLRSASTLRIFYVVLTPQEEKIIQALLVLNKYSRKIF